MGTFSKYGPGTVSLDIRFQNVKNQQFYRKVEMESGKSGRKIIKQDFERKKSRPPQANVILTMTQPIDLQDQQIEKKQNTSEKNGRAALSINRTRTPASN